MIRGIAVAICGMFLLAACGSKASEPIDPARVATNRAILEKCRITSCIGGFAIQRSDGRILRIGGGSLLRFETIGIVLLENAGEKMINQFEFVLPGDRPKWDKVAVAYSLQFTPIPAPH